MFPKSNSQFPLPFLDRALHPAQRVVLAAALSLVLLGCSSKATGATSTSGASSGGTSGGSGCVPHDAGETAGPWSGFAPQWATPLGQAAYSVVAGDLNGDGKLDLIVVTQGASDLSLLQNQMGTPEIDVLLGRGDGTFVAGVPILMTESPQFVAIADVDGDGKPDLAVAVQNFTNGPGLGDNSLDVMLGHGDGTFGAPISFNGYVGSGAPFENVVPCDFNRDGDLDLAIPSGDYVAILLGHGDGTFSTLGPNISTGPGTNSRWVVPEDLNGDGLLDLAVVESPETGGASVVGVLLAFVDGGMAPPVAYPVGLSAVAAVVADFNHDCKPDLAVVNMGNGWPDGGSISLLLGKGGGEFSPAVTLATTNSPFSIATGDFNGDGHPDLAVGGTGGLGILLGNGDGTFVMVSQVESGPGPGALSAGDFNADGISDLETSFGDVNDGGIAILLGR